jgi:hypothetical protein
VTQVKRRTPNRLQHACCPGQEGTTPHTSPTPKAHPSPKKWQQGGRGVGRGEGGTPTRSRHHPGLQTQTVFTTPLTRHTISCSACRHDMPRAPHQHPSPPSHTALQAQEDLLAQCRHKGAPPLRTNELRLQPLSEPPPRPKNKEQERTKKRNTQGASSWAPTCCQAAPHNVVVGSHPMHLHLHLRLLLQVDGLYAAVGAPKLGPKPPAASAAPTAAALQVPTHIGGTTRTATRTAAGA